MYFFKTFNLRMLKMYLLSYFSLFFHLPELLFSRAKVQKSKNKNISVRYILNLAPHYPPLLEGLCPYSISRINQKYLLWGTE